LTTKPVRSKDLTPERRQIFFGALLTATIVLLVLAAILLLTHQNSGDPVTKAGNTEDTREVVKILLDSYSTLITVATGSFAALAFLITLQQGHSGKLTNRGWVMFSMGVVALVFALLLAFVGREELLLMVTRNAFDANLPVLTLIRWLSYFCMIAAAILISSFALDVALNPKVDSK
jgi:hypothetical protein